MSENLSDDISHADVISHAGVSAVLLQAQLNNKGTQQNNSQSG